MQIAWYALKQSLPGSKKSARACSAGKQNKNTKTKNNNFPADLVPQVLFFLVL